MAPKRRCLQVFQHHVERLAMSPRRSFPVYPVMFAFLFSMNGCGSDARRANPPERNEQQAVAEMPGKPPVGPTETQPPTEPTPESAAEAPVALDIASINKQFAGDWQNTVRQYRGKVLEITARATGPSVPDYPTMRYQLLLNESGQTIGGGVTIDARVSAQSHKTARSISAGQLVTVRGKYVYVGAESRDWWTLENAEAVHFGDDPAVAVTAEALTAEFAKDAHAAHERFVGKTLLIEGTLLRQSADRAFVVWRASPLAACGFPRAGRWWADGRPR
jgi:hypothetical protein